MICMLLFKYFYLFMNKKEVEFSLMVPWLVGSSEEIKIEIINFEGHMSRIFL